MNNNNDHDCDIDEDQPQLKRSYQNHNCYPNIYIVHLTKKIREGFISVIIVHNILLLFLLFFRWPLKHFCKQDKNYLDSG